MKIDEIQLSRLFDWIEDGTLLWTDRNTMVRALSDGPEYGKLEYTLRSLLDDAVARMD